MAEVGRHLWSSSGPTSLLKQGHLQPVAQEHVWMAFKYLQGGECNDLPAQPVPVISHSHSEKVFPDVWTEHQTSFLFFCAYTGHEEVFMGAVSLRAAERRQYGDRSSMFPYK